MANENDKEISKETYGRTEYTVRSESRCALRLRYGTVRRFGC
jgi:hypothetical protein